VDEKKAEMFELSKTKSEEWKKEGKSVRRLFRGWVLVVSVFSREGPMFLWANEEKKRVGNTGLGSKR